MTSYRPESMKDFQLLLSELYKLHKEAYVKNNPFQKTGPVGKETFGFSLSAIRHAEALAETGDPRQSMQHKALSNKFLGLVPSMIQAIQRDYSKNPKQPGKGYLPGHHWSEIQKDYTNIWIVLKTMDKDIANGMEMKDVVNRDFAEPLQKHHLEFQDDYFNDLCFELVSDFMDMKTQEKAKEPEKESEQKELA